MKKTAGTLLHNKNKEVGSMLQLQLRKKSGPINKDVNLP
jgi:hypothetical protein